MRVAQSMGHYIRQPCFSAQCFEEFTGLGVVLPIALLSAKYQVFRIVPLAMQEFFLALANSVRS